MVAVRKRLGGRGRLPRALRRRDSSMGEHRHRWGCRSSTGGLQHRGQRRRVLGGSRLRSCSLRRGPYRGARRRRLRQASNLAVPRRCRSSSSSSSTRSSSSSGSRGRRRSSRSSNSLRAVRRMGRPTRLRVVRQAIRLRDHATRRRRLRFGVGRRPCGRHQPMWPPLPRRRPCTRCLPGQELGAE